MFVQITPRPSGELFIQSIYISWLEHGIQVCDYVGSFLTDIFFASCPSAVSSIATESDLTLGDRLDPHEDRYGPQLFFSYPTAP
jgi:hypothetical protein